VKGKQVLVEGETRTRQFQGQDGANRYVTEVVVGFGGTVVLLNGNGKSQSDSSGGEPPAEDEDIPF
jgi:single-strand DNA-binding protein